MTPVQTLHLLSETTAEALYLIEAKGLTQVEAAKRLECSQPSVWFRLRRAHEQIRFISQLSLHADLIASLQTDLSPFLSQEDIDIIYGLLDSSTQSNVARGFRRSQGFVRYRFHKAIAVIQSNPELIKYVPLLQLVRANYGTSHFPTHHAPTMKHPLKWDPVLADSLVTKILLQRPATKSIIHSNAKVLIPYRDLATLTGNTTSTISRTVQRQKLESVQDDVPGIYHADLPKLIEYLKVSSPRYQRFVARTQQPKRVLKPVRTTSKLDDLITGSTVLTKLTKQEIAPDEANRIIGPFPPGSKEYARLCQIFVKRTLAGPTTHSVGKNRHV